MNITVDDSAAMNRLNKVLDAVGKPGMEKLGKGAVIHLNRDTQVAFLRKADPSSGKPWAPAKTKRPWSLLLKSGRLRGLLYGDYHAWQKGVASKVYLKIRMRDYPVPRTAAHNYRVWKMTRKQRRAFGIKAGRGITGYYGIALLHIYGTKDRTVPRRKFVGISSTTRSTVKRQLQAILHEAVTR